MKLMLIACVCLLKGTGSQLPSTQRPWPQPHPWAQIPIATNPPDISAETVTPTPPVIGTTVNFEPPTSSSLPHTHHRHNHRTDSKMHTMDQLFLSRLRNRYRQVRGAKVWLVAKVTLYVFATELALLTGKCHMVSQLSARLPLLLILSRHSLIDSLRLGGWPPRNLALTTTIPGL